MRRHPAGVHSQNQPARGIHDQRERKRLTFRVLKALHFIQLDFDKWASCLSDLPKKLGQLKSRLIAQKAKLSIHRTPIDSQQTGRLPVAHLGAQKLPEAKVHLPLLLPDAGMMGGR